MLHVYIPAIILPVGVTARLVISNNNAYNPFEHLQAFRKAAAQYFNLVLFSVAGRLSSSSRCTNPSSPSSLFPRLFLAWPHLLIPIRHCCLARTSGQLRRLAEPIHPAFVAIPLDFGLLTFGLDVEPTDKLLPSNSQRARLTFPFS